MSDTRPPLQTGLKRRDFVRSASLAAAGLTIVPRHVLGRGQTAPSDLRQRCRHRRRRHGPIQRHPALASQNIVALCDVDWSFVVTWFRRPPAAGSTAGGESAWPKPVRAYAGAEDARPRTRLPA